MTYTISKTNLINDCCLIFGSEIFNFVDFLNNLSPAELKSAYRKKALESHPDRALTLGKCKNKMDEHFKSVITAYERLDSIIQGENKYIISDDPKKKRTKKNSRHPRTKQKSSAGFSYKSDSYKTEQVQKKPNRNSGFFYEGNIPKRKLLIGQFLYYSGLISWNTLFEAVYWQRKQRPIIGKIALDWGILTLGDIRKILAERSYKENFGEYALRSGFITTFQHLAIVGKQRNMQPLIGKFFIQQGILKSNEMKKMTESLKIHNTKVTNSDRRLSH
ncbi:MAG: J domain-containing protein [Candidatus Scalindua sp.]